MVLNIKELNLDKDKKYIVFFDGAENGVVSHSDIWLVRKEFERLGFDNTNIFYFPCPIIIKEE